VRVRGEISRFRAGQRGRDRARGREGERARCSRGRRVSSRADAECVPEHSARLRADSSGFHERASEQRVRFHALAGPLLLQGRRTTDERIESRPIRRNPPDSPPAAHISTTRRHSPRLRDRTESREFARHGDENTDVLRYVRTILHSCGATWIHVTLAVPRRSRISPTRRNIERKGRRGEKKGERDSERAREKERVCVCARV